MIWRQTKNPYFILVSEIMLQQTNVSRVTKKYIQFIREFPTIESLANAPLSDVLVIWNGLGYNNRAKYLKLSAMKIFSYYQNKFPEEIKILSTLPGIGKATAAAILTYAFNKPIPYIETNVRTVFIYHFFSQKKKVSDKELEPLVEKALEIENPREWYWALMDYGSYLKKIYGNLSQKSSQYQKQSQFNGSRRQMRSAIIKLLIEKKELSKENILKFSGFTTEKITEVLNLLKNDNLIKNVRDMYSLAI